MKKLLLSQKNNNSDYDDVGSPWSLEFSQFDPSQEKLREAMCTLGNGYLATRGAINESPASRIHYPGTYMAGVYNRLVSHISGRTISNDDLVNCPNWLPLTIKLEGSNEWIIPKFDNLIAYYQQLDFKNALLLRNYKIKEKNGRITTFKTRRLVHMGKMHFMAQEYSIIPENYHGNMVIQSGLHGDIKNQGVARYSDLNSLHLMPNQMGHFAENGIFIAVITNQSRIKIALASSTIITSKQQRLKSINIRTLQEEKNIFQEFSIQVKKKQEYTINKYVSVYTSQDSGADEPLKNAIESVRHCPNFSSLYQSNKKVWSELWNIFDIKVEGDNFSQKILRLHLFHLLETASIHNPKLDVGIPARGLSGEAYRGHIFWDEMFILPIYNLHFPEIAQSTLLYRYRRLKQARKYALDNGYRGAMFPWQSSSTGEEETQIIHLNPRSGKWGPDYSRKQRHISFSIAYNLWEYWKTTKDYQFLFHYGAELLLSITQFGNSLSYYDHKDRRYHTDGLMGPDEFHERLPGAKEAGFKDNAYTNIMIVWTLTKSLELLSSLLPPKNKKELMKKLDITKNELKRWEDITKKMNIIIDKSGIISQFDGYFKLKELDWKAYRKEYGNIQRMDRILKAEGKSPNDYKVSKQADLLMLPYLFSLSELIGIFNHLGYQFNLEILQKNYDYYLQRTSHGSTLSKVVYCYLADLLGQKEQSWKWFIEILQSDLKDLQGGTTPEGIHTGVMGGSINIVMKRYAGVHLVDDIIQIDPNLPLSWKKICLKIRFKQTWYILEIEKHQMVIELSGQEEKDTYEKVIIQNKEYEFCINKKYRLKLK